MAEVKQMSFKRMSLVHILYLTHFKHTFVSYEPTDRKKSDN